MEELFKRHIARLVPQAQAKKFLLAVSGGADSSVLAYLFDYCGLSFAIAHCNFHLRGEDSNKDMELVRKKAKRYGVPYFEKEFDTLSYQQKEGLSLEMAARELRYDWFAEIDQDFDFVVTAHNANDNAETFLLNMTRGTGLKGLTGIPEQNGKLLRPLLPFSSEEIRRFAVEKGIEYRNDASNFTEDFQRNKIRLSVIPKLKELNPELISIFTRNIDLLRRQFQYYQQQMGGTISSVMSKDNDTIYISISNLKKCEDPALVLYEILKDYGFNPSMVGQILDTTGKTSGKYFFSSAYQLVKDRNYLLVSHRDKRQEREIEIREVKDLEPIGFSVEELTMEKLPEFDPNPAILYVDADKLKFPLTLRHWQEGDSFHPFGMRGKKKLSDYFIDHKINLLEKKKILLLCSEEKIVWLVGLRSDDRFKIDNQTKKYYKITYHGSI
jgi:tRNA(Ile)-lysidine synthase